MTNTKKTPVRSCIACKARRDKQDLLRVVRTPEGAIVFDRTGKQNGRGAYVCDTVECVEKCLKKRLLNKVFHTEVPSETYEKLSEEYGNKQD